MCESQIVLVPHLGDQILNAKLLVEELRVEVKVEREENGWISKESLNKGIKLVMDEGSEVGEIVKHNHASWKEALGRGFMSNCVDGFVQNLRGFSK